MSLSTSDLTELLEMWEELNLTGAAHHNLSHVEAVVCSGAVGHAAFLQVLSVLYVFIFLVGVAANGLVVLAGLRADRKRREAQLFVLNLAVADLCAAATLPVWAASLLRGGRWPFGEAACKLTHLVFSVNLFGSIFFLACVSVDRYLSAAAPGGRRRPAARRLTCVLVWLLALAASAPDAYFLQAVPSAHRDGAVCRPVYPADNPRAWMAGVQLSFIVLGFAVPFPVIAVFYLLLAAALPAGSDRERRVVLAYVVVFLACWLPFHAVLLLDLLALLGVLAFSCRLEGFLDAALHLTQCCALLHCCLNPLLYSLLSRGRMDLVKAFLFRCSTKTFRCSTKTFRCSTKTFRCSTKTFRYSTKTGLARLIDGSQASETEDSAVDSGVPMGTLHGPLCSQQEPQPEPQQEPQPEPQLEPQQEPQPEPQPPPEAQPEP